VQRMPKSWEKSARETHNMIEIRKKCSAVRKSKKAKGSRSDRVHTRSDGPLPD
jgi:hypothetical protein